MLEPELPRKTRISPRVREAVRLMVDLGRKRADAAREAGITDDGLYRALERPDVRAYRNHLMQVFRESAASRSLARVDNLADASSSESVKFEANKLLLGLEGISPVTKTENLNIIKDMRPGLTINMLVQTGPITEPRLIDGQAREAGIHKVINGLPQPVPHPSMRNAANPPQIAATAGKAPRGKK